MKRLIYFFVFVLIVALTAPAACGNDTSDADLLPDASAGDGDTDSDTDGDTDGDADGDSDADADGDADVSFVASCRDQAVFLTDGTSYTICEEYYENGATLEQDCAIVYGTWSLERCPTANLSGTCTLTAELDSKQFFYGVTADNLSNVQGLCEGRPGVWE